MVLSNTNNFKTDQFVPQIDVQQVLTIWISEDLGVMTMKMYPPPYFRNWIPLSDAVVVNRKSKIKKSVLKISEVPRSPLQEVGTAHA